MYGVVNDIVATINMNIKNLDKGDIRDSVFTGTSHTSPPQ